MNRKTSFTMLNSNMSLKKSKYNLKNNIADSYEPLNTCLNTIIYML